MIDATQLHHIKTATSAPEPVHAAGD